MMGPAADDGGDDAPQQTSKEHPVHRPGRIPVVLAVLATAIAALLVPASSAAAAPASTLTASVSRAVVTFGDYVTVYGRLTDRASGAPVAGAEVDLYRERSDGVKLVGTSTTGPDGRVSMVVRPTRHTRFSWSFAGSAEAAAAASPQQRVLVRHRLEAAIDRAAVRLGRERTISGRLTPAHAGRAIRLERRRDGAWRLVDRAALSGTGRFSFQVRPTTTGRSRYRVVRRADAAHLAAAARVARLDAFRLHTYVVRKRGDVRVDMRGFRAAAAAIYADDRGWKRAHHRFRRVASGGQFTVVMSQARYLPTYASICSTQWSCRAGRYVVINQTRWRKSSPYFPGSLGQYRRMLLNHETGHWLGMGHRYCAGDGRAAPVMQQQSKGMQGCRPNAWPLPSEIRAAR
jgi:hypothetical protein